MTANNMSNLSNAGSTPITTARLAKFSDYEAVMDINRDVYRGFDYLYNMYYPLLHSGMAYPYVGEVDGQIVVFGILITDITSKSIYSMSGRAKANYNGRGIFLKMVNFSERHAKDELKWPKLLKELQMETARSAKFLKENARMKVVELWTYLLFKVTNKKMQMIKAKSTSSTSAMLTSFNSATAMLPELVRFIQQHTTHVGLYQLPFIPRAVSILFVRQMLQNNDVIMTKDRRGAIIAISVFHVLSNQNGPLSSIRFLGTRSRDFFEHIQLWVNKLAEIQNPQNELAYSLHLNVPKHLNTDEVLHELERMFGERIKLNDGRTTLTLVQSKL